MQGEPDPWFCEAQISTTTMAGAEPARRYSEKGSPMTDTFEMHRVEFGTLKTGERYWFHGTPYVKINEDMVRNPDRLEFAFRRSDIVSCEKVGS